MAVINEEALIKEIKSGRPSRVYALFGEDSFLKKHYFSKLCDISYGGEAFFNLQHFEGEIDLQNVYDAVKQFPMMADSKCVTVSDFDFEKCEKSELDRFCSLISEVDEGCVLILRFDAVEVDYKRSQKAKRVMDAVEKNFGKAVLLDHRPAFAIAKMLVEGAKKRSCALSDANARLMIELVGDDIATLQNELEKLCAFVISGEITKHTIENNVVKSVEASVYDYVKQIINGDLQRALISLNNLFYLRIEPMSILYNVSGSYVDMYRVYCGSKVGVKNPQIATDFAYKNKAFLLDKAQVNLRKFDKNKLKLSINALVWADKALKSNGAIPENIMEQLTIKLVYIVLKGEALV